MNSKKLIEEFFFQHRLVCNDFKVPSRESNPDVVGEKRQCL
jgi:hypothetical protein